MSNTKTANERGIVAIFVTMILMIVISLIVIGFSQVARRNQREALDRQLSTQAYYAAESGVNAAAKYFSSHPTASDDTLTTPDCKGSIGSGALVPPIQISTGISTPCLMVNAKPASLVANPVTQDSNIVWHVQNDAGAAYTGLTFTWAADNGFSGVSSCGSAGHPPHGNTAGTWKCKFALLRVDIVPASAGNLGNLTSTTKTIFMTPAASNSANPVQVTSGSIASDVSVVRTPCSNVTNQCSVQLTGLGASEYYVRITALYQDSASVTLVGSDAGHTTPAGGAKFLNGQAVVDSTGQAQDERRRIQVRIPLIRAEDNLPLFGVQSTQAICKQLHVLTAVTPTGCY